jgi:beta-glucosidase
MTESPRRFPADFLFGAATASYQIEGAVTEDGRGQSIWDTFSHTPGRTHNGDTGDVADDHYHRYAADVAMMKELGLQAYRFSFAWPRVQPTGSGEWNQAGFDFYHKLLDELETVGIKPIATLYHWDLPQALEDQGGWPNRDTAFHFETYAAKMAEEFGDRIDMWTTFNEPWCSAFLGYASGAHAPGRGEPAASLAAMHHLNLAHGLAGRAIRARHPHAQISYVLNAHVPRVWDPANPLDIAAARLIDGLANRVWFEPVVHGTYPQDVIDATQDLTDWAFVHDGDLDICKGPLDFIGVNYYSSHMVRHNDHPDRSSGADGHGTTQFSCWPGADHVEFMPLVGPQTSMGWNVDPSAFTGHLLRMARDTGLPLVVTENGSAWEDTVSPAGRVHDPERTAYIHDHLGAVLDAIDQGADIRGYMVWSFMDNFEWGRGYSKRFGVIRVDYDTQERIWKDSAYYYQAVLRERALVATDAVK